MLKICSLLYLNTTGRYTSYKVLGQRRKESLFETHFCQPNSLNSDKYPYILRCPSSQGSQLSSTGEIVVSIRYWRFELANSHDTMVSTVTTWDHGISWQCTLSWDNLWHMVHGMLVDSLVTFHCHSVLKVLFLNFYITSGVVLHFQALTLLYKPFNSFVMALILIM